MANITISAGVSSSGINVNVGDNLYVQSGGTATETVENGGYVEVQVGATADFAANTITGLAFSNTAVTVHKNTQLNENSFVGDYSFLYVYDGGIASGNAFDASRARVVIFDGGLATGMSGYIGSGYINVSSGGSAENTVFSESWSWGGHLNVFAGATVTGTTVNTGYQIVKSGGVANKTLLAGGAENVDGGGVDNDSVLIAGSMNVASEGLVTGATVNLGTVLNFSAGASGSGIMETGGAVNVAEGATVDFAENTITGLAFSNTAVTVHKNTQLNGNSFVGDSSFLYVFDGGIASGNTFDASRARVEVIGGTVTGMSGYFGSGYFNVSSGGSAENTVFSESWSWGGHMNVFAGATVTGTTVNTGYQIVKSGGVANKTLLAGGAENVDGGGVDNDSVLIAGTMNVASEGLVTGATVNLGTVLNFSAGASGSGIMETGGAVNVAEGATVDFAENTITGLAFSNTAVTVHKNTQLNGNSFVGDSSFLYVFDGGIASGNTFDASRARVDVIGGTVTGMSGYIGSGYINVSSGGSAENTVFSESWSWGGHLNVFAGATVTGTTVNTGYQIVKSGGVANKTLLAGGAENVDGGGVDNDAVLIAGTMNVASEGLVTGTTVNSGTTLNFSAGANGNGIVENGGAVNVAEGATVDFAENTITGLAFSNTAVTVHKNTQLNGNSFVGDSSFLYVFDGGIASGNTFDASRARVEVLGGTVNGMSGYIGSGYFNVSSGGSAENTVFSESWSWGGHLNVFAGATVTGTTVNTGYQIVKSGGVANKTLLAGGAENVDGGGVDNDSVLIAGTMNVASEGLVTGTTVNSGTTLNFSAGATGNGIVENGGTVNVTEGATVDFAENTITGLAFSNTAVTVHKNTQLNGNSFVGDSSFLYVFDGGIASGNTFDASRARVDVIGGTVTGMSGYFGSGYFNVSSGGSAENTVFSESWSWGGHMNVFAGAIVTGTTVNAGHLIVNSGATANDTLTTGGNMIISSGAVVNGATAAGGTINVSSGAVVRNVGAAGGSVVIASGADVIGVGIDGGAVSIAEGVVVKNVSGTAGKLNVAAGAKVTGTVDVTGSAELAFASGSTLEFDISWMPSPSASLLVSDISLVTGDAALVLTVSETQDLGTYYLAGGAADFDGAISVVDTAGNELGTLTVDTGFKIGEVNYTLWRHDGEMCVVIEEPETITTRSSDIDGNHISDVMFVWSGNNYMHGYWMNGSDTWLSANSPHPVEWDNLGCYDMTGNGKADSILVGNVVVSGVKGAYIGFYRDAYDNPDGSTWVNIGYLTNEGDIDWKNKIGNLTGNESGVNSIAWFTHELGALGAWVDGTDEWVGIAGGLDDTWTLIGCGDFDGDGKDSVVMSELGGQSFYTYDLDGTKTSMGAANWSGWEVRAIGDFLGDGKDDLVLFHNETGSMVMLADGNLDDYTSIGQLDATDWFVVGAGDYNGDQQDDLLVRQYSTGMLGYYRCADQSRWVELGRGVDMNWTVIA